MNGLFTFHISQIRVKSRFSLYIAGGSQSRITLTG